MFNRFLLQFCIKKYKIVPKTTIKYKTGVLASNTAIVANI